MTSTSDMTSTPDQPVRKKRKGRIVGAVVVGALAVAGVGFGVLVLTGNEPYDAMATEVTITSGGVEKKITGEELCTQAITGLGDGMQAVRDYWFAEDYSEAEAAAKETAFVLDACAAVLEADGRAEVAVAANTVAEDIRAAGNIAGGTTDDTWMTDADTLAAALSDLNASYDRFENKLKGY